MKIAYFVSTFYPRIGGMGKICLMEAMRMSKKHDVTVFTLDYGDELNVNDQMWSFKIVRLSPLLLFGDAGLLPDLISYLSGFDLVHLHYPFYGALSPIIKAKKLIGFPLIVTYHMDAQGEGVKKLLQNCYDAIYSQKLFDLADKILIVDSDYYQSSKFKQYIHKEKTIELSNAVDEHIFIIRNETWSGLGHPELMNKKTILFVGNFLPVKNIYFLISLLFDLPDDVFLVIVGGGYNEKKIKKFLEKLNIKNRIVFTSYITDEHELSSYYSASNIVAIPSLSESFSLVAVEAMMSGGIVLANDIAGIKGRIKDGINGFLAEKNNRLMWLNKINMILDLSESEKKELKIRSRENALQYSCDKHIDVLEAIYSNYY